MKTIVIGVDPGAKGGIAAIDRKGRVASARLDTKDPAALRKALDGFALLRGVKPEAVVVYIEDVYSRPGEGHVGVFSFGRAKGTPHGFLAALGYEVRFVSPQAWQSEFFGDSLHGVDPDSRKAAILDAARSRWRRHEMPCAADESRAAALFIGLCGALRDHGW